MPDPNTIPFKEADGNGHYRSKQLPQDRGEFLEALGLPEFAGDVVSASGGGTAGGEVTTFWGTDGHTIKAATQTGLAKLSAGVLSAVPAPSGQVVGTTDVQTLTNKTLDNATYTGTVIGIDKFDVGLGNVDNTSDVNKPLSNADVAALAAKEDKPSKGIANGYAGLDTIGKVPLAQLPDAIIGASRYQGTWNAAINNPTIPPAAPANNGYYYSVSTSGSTNIDGISTWAIGDTIISNGTIWQKIPVANAVQSVNGKQGIVVVNKNDVGLGNVDNTSDATKNSAAGTLTNKTINGANNTILVRLNTPDVTGSLPVANLDGGSGAGPTTFWRGDGHWVSPTGAGDVQGPGSSVTNDIAVFSGTTGKIIATSGKLISDVVVGPAASTDGHIVQFNGSTGKVLKDGLVAPTGTIVGTTDAQILSNKQFSYGTVYRPRGVIYCNPEAFISSGTAEQTAQAYVIPVGVFGKAGDAVKIKWIGVDTGATGAKTKRVKVNNVVISTPAGAGGTLPNYVIEAYLQRYSHATFLRTTVSTMFDDGTAKIATVDTQSATVDFAATIPIAISVQASAGNCTIYSMTVEAVPAP